MVGAVATVLLLLTGALVYQFWPRPTAPLTLAELEGIYYGMVRSDGTNDASRLERRNASTREVEVSPEDCAPLFDATVFNQFPAEAIDGVGTYWLGGRDSISMFSMRFADATAATRAYTRVLAAVDACTDRDVRVRTQRRSDTVRPQAIPVTDDSGVPAQIAYTYSTEWSSNFAVHLLQFENTVTWQFRYETGDVEYSPLAAQQLMNGLILQTRAVLELRE